MADPKFLLEKHVKYIQELDTHKDDLQYWLTEHLRLSGVYWGLTALDLMGWRDALPREEMIDFVLGCRHDNGGFGAQKGHDPHLLYTLSAVQVLVIQDALDRIDIEKTVQYIASLQLPNGAFTGDNWGETDARFVYTAFNALSLLNRLDAIDIDASIQYILSCHNFDGGFGFAPGDESHGGAAFVCLGTLAIAQKLHIIVTDQCASWLSERQLPNGGLNGRPEKLEDVCYSWWDLSSLSILGRMDWISREKLMEFILLCQDPEGGGFSDRPGNMVDVFHTLFGVAGLSLLGMEGLQEVDPVYCMPKKVMERVMKGRQYS